MAAPHHPSLGQTSPGILGSRERGQVATTCRHQEYAALWKRHLTNWAPGEHRAKVTLDISTHKIHAYHTGLGEAKLFLIGYTPHSVKVWKSPGLMDQRFDGRRTTTHRYSHYVLIHPLLCFLTLPRWPPPSTSCLCAVDPVLFCDCQLWYLSFLCLCL